MFQLILLLVIDYAKTINLAKNYTKGSFLSTLPTMYVYMYMYGYKAGDISTAQYGKCRTSTVANSTDFRDSPNFKTPSFGYR